MCALWTFMIALFYVLPDSACQKSYRVFFPFATTAWYFIRVICVFWQEFSLFLIRCALYLHARLLWLWFLEMRLNIACRFLHVNHILLDLCLKKCCIFLWNWTYASVKPSVQTCQKVVGAVSSSVISYRGQMCQNICLCSLFWYWKKKKRSHTQSRCWYFVLSVFLSLCISKATLFAFTGSTRGHESTLSAVVNVQVTFTFPQIAWSFVLGDCVVLACRGIEQEPLPSDNWPHVTDRNTNNSTGWVTQMDQE